MADPAAPYSLLLLVDGKTYQADARPSVFPAGLLLGGVPYVIVMSLN